MAFGDTALHGGDYMGTSLQISFPRTKDLGSDPVAGILVSIARLIGGSWEVIDVLNVPLLDLDHGRVLAIGIDPGEW